MPEGRNAVPTDIRRAVRSGEYGSAGPSMMRRSVHLVHREDLDLRGASDCSSLVTARILEPWVGCHGRWRTC